MGAFSYIPGTSVLTISKATQRRFILGKQGLYPGRRWQGKEGVVQAIRAGSVVQVDPLNVVSRNQDIVLYGRVREYQPAHLDAALYTDRALFDYGGTVMIHPMEELPFWRVVMARKQHEPRWAIFAHEHAKVIDDVLTSVRERGPLSTRAFESAPPRQGNFRSGKVTGLALYYLWLAGEFMTHSRKGFDRLFDVRERVAPPQYHRAATPDEADNFFAPKVFQEHGLVTARSWRNWFVGLIERPVDTAEATARLDALLATGKIAQITLEGDPKNPRFVLAEDLPLLEMLHTGNIPGEWQPVGTSTRDEMIFLAPLEIVSTRGRAQVLFDFEYLWEVYKPAEKRRWGYYTLPILYQDRLVARLDPKFERSTGTLLIKGFWLENNISVDDQFIAALAAALKRFTQFVGASAADLAALAPPEVREAVQLRLNHSP